LFKLATGRSDIAERLRQSARSGKHGVYKNQNGYMVALKPHAA
jgi:hypothetical protein